MPDSKAAPSTQAEAEQPSYSLNKYVALQAVFGAFFPKLGGSLLRGNGYYNESTEVWGYLQTDLKF